MGHTNRTSSHPNLAAALALCIAAAASQGAMADITATGDVSPTDPSTWNSFTTAYIGQSWTGALNITNGAILNSGAGYIGYSSGATGIVTVDGPGSTWNSWRFLYVGSQYFGDSGTGVLNITHGGVVSSGDACVDSSGSGTATATVDGPGSTFAVGGSLYVGSPVIDRPGTGTLNITNGGSVVAGQGTFVVAASSINFGPNGGTLTTAGLVASPSQLTGSGTINTSGLVSDSDLIFDASHGLAKTFLFGNVTVNLNQNSDGVLGVGNLGSATLTVKDGFTLSSADGYLGYGAGSSGAASVTGPDSSWTIGRNLWVGHGGSGILSITQGATAASAAANIGSYDVNGTSAVTIDGLGSTWNIGSFLNVGQSGTANVSITHGGVVNSAYSVIDNYDNGPSTATVTVDGPASTWTLSNVLFVGQYGTGTLNITNGASVVSNSDVFVATASSINFGPHGGSLTTAGLIASSSQLTGTGTINTTGLVSDIDLVFDSSHGLARTFSWGNVTVNLNQSASGVLGAGNVGSGTLTIHDGFQITSLDGYIGYCSGSLGTATVSGSGSSWTVGGLVSGYSGTGILNITNGGTVNSMNASIGGNNGAVIIDGSASTWNNNNSLEVGGLGSDTLSIIRGGTLHNSWAYIGTGTISVDGPGSTWTNDDLMMGFVGGSSLLNITHGGTVTCSFATIGGSNGGTGIVTVDGAGSSFLIKEFLAIGQGATSAANVISGTLNVTHGGIVISSSNATIGYGGTGTATVDGHGSTWTISTYLSIGYDYYGLSTGTLNITRGGTVTANSLTILPGSLLAMDVGAGRSITISGYPTFLSMTGTTGPLTNDGTIRLTAAPAAAPGSYTPIIADSWSGSGLVQPLGGSWNPTSHTFTITPPTLAPSNTPTTIDLAATQRLLITDPATHQSVAASFQPTTYPLSLTVTATPLTAPAQALLQATTTQSILAAWSFTLSSAYTEGDPVYLSLAIGPDYTPDQLTIWHFDNTTWTPFTPTDLSYDGTYASFTATTFSSYAITSLTLLPRRRPARR